MPSDPEIPVRFRSVSYAVGGEPILSGIDIEVCDGEILILLGESGCGKSTTLKLINRLMEPNSPASVADPKIGDAIKKVNGEDVRQVPFNDLAGKTVKLTVTRVSEDIEIPMTVGSHVVTGYSLTEMTKPSNKQMKVREGWLNR